MVKKKSDTEESSILTILPLETGIAQFCVLGTTPYIANRMAEKTRLELLIPRGHRLTDQDKAAKLKHDPVKEFRGAVYAPKDKNYATRAIIPARCFGRALADAALDTPGVYRTEVLRLTTILGENGIDIPVFGIPQIYMTPVRMADKNRTPDIRTRGIFSEWACYLDIRYIKPRLTALAVGNLLARAGMILGIGDDRHEKGGNHGLFELVSADDKRFLDLVEKCGRQAQDDALANPTCFDADTEDLYRDYQVERARWDHERERSREPKIDRVKSGSNTNRNRAAILK